MVRHADGWSMNEVERISCVIRGLREADHATITARVDEWWGRPVSGALLRLFFEHFRPMSRVAERAEDIVGFIIGFQSQTDPRVAYAHFIGVAPDLRRGGLARTLYEHFFSESRDRGCTSVEAITAPINTASIAFHTRLGFELLPGTGWVDGVPVSIDHDGPGKHRARMRRAL
jgi:ribosomal protein S18 acetylase RimI-like enzyme